MAKCAKLLLGCYRTGEANDEDIYTGAIIAVLSDYPLDVIAAVVDPRSGIPSRCKWLPTVAEIKSACEEIEGPRRRAREFDEGARKQLAERKQIAIEHHRPRPTYADLAKRCADAGFPIGPRGAAAAAMPLNTFFEKYGITQEQWDAIPTHDEDRAKRERQGLP